jgi:hypothetical protein
MLKHDHDIIKDPVQFLKDSCPGVNISKMSDREISIIAKRIFLLIFLCSSPTSRSGRFIEVQKDSFFWVLLFFLPIFEKMNIFNDERIVFVDNSYIKQLIRVNQKSVFHPRILEEYKIDTVVCCYPNSMENVRLLCPPNVERNINIQDLLWKNFR